MIRLQNTFENWGGQSLQHFGTRGMKWGQRRYQNPDGSLTQLGKERYGVGGDRSRLGIKHDLNKLDREQAYAKVRADFWKNKNERKTAKIQRSMAKAKASGNQEKVAKLNQKQQKVNRTIGKKARDYSKLLNRSKNMTDKIIAEARKKGMSIHSRDCIRQVNKGRDLATSTLFNAGGIALGLATGFQVAGGYSTYTTGKHYRVKNDGLGTRTHRSGRHSRDMTW